MNTSSLIEPLEGLLLQIQQLIQLAKEGHWDELEKESLRYHQTAVFLNDDSYIQALIDADLTEPAKYLIAQIQGLNDALDGEANSARAKMASEIRQLNQAEKAVSAYGQ